MSSKCTQRFSVCRDVLFMIAEYCKKQPYEEIVGIMNALQNDPKPINADTGLVEEPPKIVVDEKKQGTPSKGV